MNYLTRAYQIWRKEGIRSLYRRSAKEVGRRGRNMWHKDHWWMGKIVELKGDQVVLDGVTLSLKSNAISTRMKSRLFRKKYEKKELEMIYRHLPLHHPLIELGGSIGFTACVSNRILENPRDHLVLEANPNLIPVLRKNRELNNAKFKIINRALAYDKSEIEFFLHEKFVGGSVQRKTGNSVFCETTTLSNLLSESGFDGISLICDIEGGEFELLKNEKKIIETHVKFMLIEFHEFAANMETIERAHEEILNLGFDILCRTGKVIAYSSTS